MESETRRRRRAVVTQMDEKEIKVPAFVFEQEQQKNEDACLKPLHNVCEHLEYDIVMINAKSINEELLHQLHLFVSKFVETVNRSIMASHLRDYYDNVLIGYTKNDKTVVAMQAGKVGIDAIDGQQYVLCKCGYVRVDKKYQGRLLPQILFLYFVLTAKLPHPTLPTYMICGIANHKAYLMGLSSFEVMYPRYDVTTPEWAQKIITKYVKGPYNETPDDKFIEETNVLEQGHGHLEYRDGVIDVTEKDLNNPHIKYFVQQNPGWHKGDRMVVLALITTEAVKHATQKVIAMSQITNLKSNL